MAFPHFPLVAHTRSDDVEHGMPYLPWTTYTVRHSLAWHVIIDLEQNTWLNDVKRGIQLSPLDNTHDKTTSGVACHRGP